MKITVIYGNPKTGGFVHDCLDLVSEHLEQSGAEVTRFRLAEKKIAECTGCFTCLRKGACVHEDDMGGIIEALTVADGLVTGASVRNGYFPALYKRFYERITYLAGFCRDLKGKPVLAIGAVGMAGGKKHLGKLLSFRDFQALPTGYLFFRTGIPGTVKAGDVAGPLRAAADRFVRRVGNPAGPPLLLRAQRALDDAVMRRFMFRKNPDGVYNHVIRVWREKGLM
jgi:NAD(P)H-dependent FMN reductase